MPNIYQLSQELLGIFSLIEENGGELTPEIEECLNITQDSFNSKIESYTNVIKQLTNNIGAIKEEKDRLNDLQKSKEKTIERLEKIIIKAINDFGNTNKNGTKYIEWETGRVSIRKSSSVEIDEDISNEIANKFLLGMKWFEMTNQLSSDFLTKDNIIEYINKNIDKDEYYFGNITEKDLDNLKISAKIEIPITNLIDSEKGFNLAKTILTNHFDCNAKISKSEIKPLKEYPIFANKLEKENLIIK